MVNTKSATGDTVVTIEAALLSKVGSATAETTLARFVIKPAMPGLTVMVTVAVALVSNASNSQVTMPFVWVKIPCVVWAETNSTLDGSESFKITPVAAVGPLLLTTSV